jgi:hypothetical protein
MQAVVDRFENGFAVLLLGEEEIRVEIPLAMLPTGVQEGDWLKVSFEPDHERTEDRKVKIQSLLDKLKHQDSQS